MDEKAKSPRQEQRFEQTVKRMLSMPRQPHKEQKQKKSENKKTRA